MLLTATGENLISDTDEVKSCAHKIQCQNLVNFTRWRKGSIKILSIFLLELALGMYENDSVFNPALSDKTPTHFYTRIYHVSGVLKHVVYSFPGTSKLAWCCSETF